MAESFAERRKRELGLTSSTASDFVTQRKMDLGLIPDTRQKDEPVEPAFTPIVPIDARKTTFGRGLTPQNETPAQTGQEITFDPSLLDRPSDRDFNPSALNRENYYKPEPVPYEPKSIAQSPLMEAAIYGLQGATQPIRDIGNATPSLNFKVPEYSPEDARFLSPTQTKIAEVAGTLAGSLPGIGASYLTGGRLAASALARSAPTVSRLAQEAVRGAGAGFTYGATGEALDVAGDTRQDGSQAFGDRLKNIATDTVLGAAGDTAFSAIGKGLKAAATKVRDGRNLRSAVDEFTTQPAQQAAPLKQNLPQTNEIEPNSQVSQPSEPLKTTEEVNAETMKGNWFTNLFGSQGLGISAVKSSRTISKDPLTTAGQIVKNPLRNDIEGTRNRVAATGRAAYQNYVDVNSPLKHISQDVYDKSLDAARANNVANVIISDKFVTPEGKVIGEGLKNTFKKVARGQMDSFNDYLVLRHAKTRMLRGEEVYARNLEMTPEKAQARVEMYDKRHPEFANIAKEWDKFNENTLKTYGVDEGLLSPELFNELRAKNPNYASMRRQFTTSEKFASPFQMSAKSSFSGQKAPIKEVSPTGSVRRIVDPRRSAIESTGAWVNAAMRNRVMTGIVDKVKVNPESMKGIVEIVQAPKGQRDLAEILSTDGAEGFIESLNDDFNQLFTRTSLDKDNIVRAMVKGKPVYMKVINPEAVKALIGMGAEQSNVVMDVFGKLSNATKYGATGALAPMFAVKGLTTDIAQSIIQSKNPGMHLWDLGHAMLSSLADTLPKNIKGIESIRALAQDYTRMGGQYSAMLRGDRPLNKSLRGMTRDPLLSPQAIGKGLGNALASPFRALHKVSDVAENVNRMAAAKGELRRLGGEKTPENVMKSMNQAREITTNFSRRGSKSQNIEKFIPYSNAAVQGLHRFAMAWKKNPVKTSALVGGAVMLPKAIEYFRFHDDPDYQDIPAREKYRNMILSKNADGTFVKVPMPPEYNALGAFMVDSLEKLRDDNPQAFKGSADAITNAYTPPFVSGLAQGITQGGGLDKSMAGSLNSTVLAPVAALQANKSFTGAPIEPMGMQGSPKYRYDERTSSVAKKLGELINYSPKKIDYVIRAYGGDPARLLLPLTTDVGAGTTRNTLLKNFIVDPVFTNNLANDYYEAKEKITQVQDDFRDHKIPLPTWFNETIKREFTSTAAGSYGKRLSLLSDRKKELNADKTLSKDEKADLLRGVQAKINDLYIELNSKADAAGIFK